VNLGGGFHHAQADKAEGFCAIADVAIAIRCLQAAGEIRRALIVDLDYHHGNGNAQIFAEDENVFTFSMHAGNWCWISKRNNRDVELAPGTDDSAYLQALDRHLPQIIEEFQPDFAVYVAGSDPHCEDLLGDFAISEAGMLARDRTVTRLLWGRGIPMVVVTAGGYGPVSWRIHFNYFRWLLETEGHG
jgi:acetoin utilization deacetylase AcuC-like enzyme